MKEKKQKLIDITTVKFLLVGVINTLVGTGTMFGLYNCLGCSYWVSSAGNYIVGSIVSYFLNKYFTFQDRQKSGKQIAIFVINITVCYGLAYGLAKPVVTWLLQNQSQSIKDNLSMLVGMGAFVVFNYIGQRLVVFRKK